MFLQLGTIIPYFTENSNEWYATPFERLANFNYFEPILGRPINYGDLVVGFACLSGIHFNLHNIISSFLESDKKCYGLLAMMPYVQFFFMLFISSYSRLFTDHVFLFVVTAGLYLLYVTGILNVCTMSGKKFECFYYEPVLWAAIVMVDHTVKDLTTWEVKSMYIMYFTMTMLKYLWFMYSTIS